ncbi:MAG: sulfite exporter TauE/SafE family protein [Crocinitomicaceae bacterium]
MAYIIIALAVCFAAGLTFFSGFGLGTIMLPVFSIFFPLPIAIGATAVVHLANNLFKFGLVYKNIDFPTLLRFGIPALVFALLGALLLTQLEGFEIIYSYTIGSKVASITWLKITIGFLMIFFAWFDLSPKFSSYTFDKKYVVFGGMLSGFFGGVSGHQGAFRAAFLTKIGLTKEAFIATSNSVAILIDISRLVIYTTAIGAVSGQNNMLAALNADNKLLMVAILFAFLGTYFGKELVKKTTIHSVQKVVGILLFLMGALFLLGLI